MSKLIGPTVFWRKKRQQDKRPDLAMAFVATSSDGLPPAEPIVMAAQIAASCDTLLGQQVNAVWEKGILSFQLRDATVAISQMRAPIPWSDLEGPCATAWWWPGATERMKSHEFHFLVLINGGSFDSVHRRVVLSHLVRAVALQTDAVGVYWAEGTLVYSPQSFIKDAAEISVDRLTMNRWVDIRVTPNPDRTSRCFTTGMKPLGFMEMEVPATKMNPLDLFEFMNDLVVYVISGPNVIDHGETVGPTAELRYPVRRAPSMFDRDEVLSIAIP